MDSGESDKAVSLLHQGASQDVTKQVATRIWGANFPYADIWTDRLEAPINIPVPADVAALFGRNRLPQQASPTTYQFTHNPGETENTRKLDEKYTNRENKKATPAVIQLGEPERRVTAAASGIMVTQNESAIPESLLSIQGELEKVATRLKKRSLSQKDGRFPVYVTFTTRQGLENHYPPDQVAKVHDGMIRVTKSISSRKDWGAVLVYADDPECMSSYNLNPVSADDPWSLKLALADIDAFLMKHGEMIGAVLIVGGPEIIPYHHLPNPVDDVDVEVPSDNPYTTRDENYFVPEWPVGRLPGGVGKDAALLISSLNRIAEHHKKKVQKKNWIQRLWGWLRLRKIYSSGRKKSSWGYTAAIWRRASLSVFRPIGRTVEKMGVSRLPEWDILICTVCKIQATGTDSVIQVNQLIFLTIPLHPALKMWSIVEKLPRSFSAKPVMVHISQAKILTKHWLSNSSILGARPWLVQPVHHMDRFLLR
jgi:hypothetical protein